MLKYLSLTIFISVLFQIPYSLASTQSVPFQPVLVSDLLFRFPTESEILENGLLASMDVMDGSTHWNTMATLYFSGNEFIYDGKGFEIDELDPAQTPTLLSCQVSTTSDRETAIPLEYIEICQYDLQLKTSTIHFSLKLFSKSGSPQFPYSPDGPILKLQSSDGTRVTHVYQVQTVSEAQKYDHFFIRKADMKITSAIFRSH